jgi:crotonobetainyl-CoA:carnitine CoA-transferase CaiB-like acyl-CoA transferase
MTLWMAGPVAGMLLGDLGADVVKIESAKGDPTRSHVAPTAGAPSIDLERTSISYSSCNRNKRSLILDLGAVTDRATFERLVDRADVFITNMSMPTIRKLKIDETTLRDRNPRLIYAHGSGLGPNGPRAEDLAQDMTGMAYAGMLFTMSPDPDEPFAPPGAMNDMLTGTMLASGVLAALVRRNRTGQGETVTASLLQSSLWAQMLLVGSVANTVGAATNGRPRTDPRNAMVNQYRAADGRWIAIAAVNSGAWKAFVDGAEIGHLVADPRFATYETAVQHSREMRVELDRHFASRTAEEWLSSLRRHGVWCGPANRLSELLDDEQIAANDYLVTLTDGLRTVAGPFTLSDYELPLTAGPALDGDRAAILEEWRVAPG